MKVWIDQDLCTGDGLCVQLAPQVFEFDVDGLAYVKDGDVYLLEVNPRASRTAPFVVATWMGGPAAPGVVVRA